MSFRRRTERYRLARPAPLDKVVSTYYTQFSRYPEQVRILFADGTTEVYYRRVELPAPIVTRKGKK